MSRDASVAALMDHMNDVDKRRRLTVMQQRETEAKLAHAAQERKDIDRQKAEMLALELQLQKDLDELTGEQRRVQLQLFMETDRVRHCDVEEPLLQALAANQLRKLEDEQATWAANLADLDALAAAWQDDPCMRAVRDQLATAESRAAELKAQHERFEGEVVMLRLKAAAIRDAREAALTAGAGGTAVAHDAAAAAHYFSPGAPSEDTKDGELLALQDRLQQEDEEWRQLEANLARQATTVQREVDDLTSRSEELHGMLLDVQASTARLQAGTETLAKCVAAGCCAACLHSEQ